MEIQISNVLNMFWILVIWNSNLFRISDFDLVFGDAKTFARLCKEFLGHNTDGLVKSRHSGENRSPEPL